MRTLISSTTFIYSREGRRGEGRRMVRWNEWLIWWNVVKNDALASAYRRVEAEEDRGEGMRYELIAQIMSGALASIAIFYPHHFLTIMAIRDSYRCVSMGERVANVPPLPIVIDLVQGDAPHLHQFIYLMGTWLSIYLSIYLTTSDDSMPKTRPPISTTYHPFIHSSIHPINPSIHPSHPSCYHHDWRWSPNGNHQPVMTRVCMHQPEKEGKMKLLVDYTSSSIDKCKYAASLCAIRWSLHRWIDWPEQRFAAWKWCE